MHRHSHTGLALAAAALFVLGCDAGDAPDAADDPADAPAGAVEAPAELAPVNRSGVTGTVRADHGDDETTVTIEVAGLEPGAVYPAHIHTGRCVAGGPVALPLGRMTATQDGTGRLTTRIAASQLQPDQPAFVQVHESSGSVVACADLSSHEGDVQPVTDRRPGADTPGEAEGGA